MLGRRLASRMISMLMISLNAKLSMRIMHTCVVVCSNLNAVSKQANNCFIPLFVQRKINSSVFPLKRRSRTFSDAKIIYSKYSSTRCIDIRFKRWKMNVISIHFMVFFIRVLFMLKIGIRLHHEPSTAP